MKRARNNEEPAKAPNRLQKGGGSTLSKWRKKHEENESKRRSGGRVIRAPAGVEYFKAEERGTKLFKLIPYPVKDPKHPEDLGGMAPRRPYGQHKNLGPEETDILCMAATYGKKCPVCQERDAARLRGDDTVASALNASRRALYLVVDAEAREPALLLLDQPMSMGKAPGFGRMFEDEMETLDAASPAPWDSDGPLLEVRFGKDDFKGRAFYPVTKMNFVDQDKGMDFSEFEAAAPSLDDCLVALSYDQAEKILHGVDEEEKEVPQTEDEEPPKPANRPKRSRPEPEPEPELEGTDEFTEDEVREALENIGDADHEEILLYAAKFGVVLDAGEVRASKKGDKAIRRALRATITDVLEGMLAGEEEEEEEEEAPPPPLPPTKPKRGAAPAPAAPAPKTKASTPSKGACPSGHDFGADCDEKPACKACPTASWEACASANDELKK